MALCTSTAAGWASLSLRTAAASGSTFFKARIAFAAAFSARVWTAPAWKEGARRAGRIAYRRASAAYVAEIANRARWRGRWLTPVPLAFFHLWPTLRMVATVLMRDDFHPGESAIGRWERRS